MFRASTWIHDKTGDQMIASGLCGSLHALLLKPNMLARPASKHLDLCVFASNTASELRQLTKKWPSSSWSQMPHSLQPECNVPFSCSLCRIGCKEQAWSRSWMNCSGQQNRCNLAVDNKMESHGRSDLQTRLQLQCSPALARRFWSQKPQRKRSRWSQSRSWPLPKLRSTCVLKLAHPHKLSQMLTLGKMWIHGWVGGQPPLKRSRRNLPQARVIWLRSQANYEKSCRHPFERNLTSSSRTRMPQCKTLQHLRQKIAFDDWRPPWGKSKHSRANSTNGLLKLAKHLLLRRMPSRRSTTPWALINKSFKACTMRSRTFLTPWKPPCRRHWPTINLICHQTLLPDSTSLRRCLRRSNAVND